jgi:hypothetical protein
MSYFFTRHFTVVAIQNEKRRVLADWREEKARQQRLEEDAAAGAPNGATKSPAGDHCGSADDDHYYDEARLAAKRAQVEEWRRQKAEEKKQKEASSVR